MLECINGVSSLVIKVYGERRDSSLTFQLCLLTLLCHCVLSGGNSSNLKSQIWRSQLHDKTGVKLQPRNLETDAKLV